MENKRNYKIVASDLDGTFLGKDQSISCENLQAVAEMHGRGVEFVPTTGRTLSEIPAEIIGSSDVRYIITSDGAAVWDKRASEMILTRYIPKDTVKFILDTLKPYNVYPLAHISGENHYDIERHNDTVFDSCHVGKYFQYIVNLTAISVSDFSDFVLDSDEVEMFCLFFESDEARERCRRIFVDSGKLCTAQSDPHNLEVYSAAAGKGNTLKALADKLSVDIADTIAVGDSTNDATLVKAAGLGLAMDNACEELKAIADKVICDNSEHAAMYILENFIK